MKTGLLLLLAVSLVGWSAEKPEKPVAPPATKAKVPRYVPPFRGAPKVRVDGGSRGGAEELPELMVVAPNHTGLTTKAQPTLVWYQSKPSAVLLEFTLLSDTEFAPLVETNLNASASGNFHPINLADYEVNLTEGTEYRWTVAFVPDPNNRSKDLVASGRIKRVAPGAELSHRLEQGESADQPFIYSEAGIYYDAFASLTALLDQDRGNANLIEQRDGLLSQVGLTNCVSAGKLP